MNNTIMAANDHKMQEDSVFKEFTGLEKLTLELTAYAESSKKNELCAKFQDVKRCLKDLLEDKTQEVDKLKKLLEAKSQEWDRKFEAGEMERKQLADTVKIFSTQLKCDM